MEQKKNVLILHHPRGFATAAAAEARAHFEKEGAHVDTLGGMAETGVTSEFFDHTLETIPVDQYDEVVILGIMLDNRDVLHSLVQLEDFAKKLERHGGKLTYLETRSLPPQLDVDRDDRVLYRLNSVRQHCRMILRKHAREGMIDVHDSERMLIGAIADRDSDVHVLDQITDRRDQVALGLDIAVRGDFRQISSLSLLYGGAVLEEELISYFLHFWDDSLLDEDLLKVIHDFVGQIEQLKKKTSDDFQTAVDELALQTFSRFFVHRAVEELYAQNYEWFLRLSERKPEFPQVDLSVSLGNLSVVPMTDVASSWDFRILNEAVQKNTTQFGLMLLRASKENRFYWEGADVFTIIKNYRYPDLRRIESIFEREVGSDWKETLMIQDIKNVEGNTVLTLEEGAESDEMIMTCIRSLFGEYRVRELQPGSILLHERTVEDVLDQVVDRASLHQYYGGKNHALFTLPRNSAQSVDIFCRLMKELVGREIDESLIPVLRELIELYTGILTKATLGMKQLSEEYLGESYEEAFGDVGLQFSQVASSLLQELFSVLQSARHPLAQMIKLQKKLRQLDQEVEVSSNLIRLLSRDEVSQLDIRKIRSLEIKKFPVRALHQKEYASLRKDILRIIEARFPDGDDQKFVDEVLEDESQVMTVVLSKGRIVAFYVVGEKNGVHHPDWFMANRKTKYKGLGEATLMLEFQSEESRQRVYEAEAKPSVKTSFISLEKLGFIAVGDTKGDPHFKERYLRVRREKVGPDGFYKRYKGKGLTEEALADLREQCGVFRRWVTLMSGLEVVKVRMPDDNTFVLDAMHERQGKMVMTRYVQDPGDSDVYYCVFEPSQELPKAADGELENPEQSRRAG